MPNWFKDCRLSSLLRVIPYVVQNEFKHARENSTVIASNAEEEKESNVNKI